MRIEQIYRTVDGSLFKDREEAVQHENDTLESWLGRIPVMDLNIILNSFDDQKNDEIYGSEKDIAMVFVERAYELSQMKGISTEYNLSNDNG